MRRGTVGGYISKLFSQSPFRRNISERRNPHPGQSILKRYLNGHGSKKISALSKKEDQADKIYVINANN
jgi:hypothetical protein